MGKGPRSRPRLGSPSRPRHRRATLHLVRTDRLPIPLSLVAQRDLPMRDTTLAFILCDAAPRLPDEQIRDQIPFGDPYSLGACDPESFSRGLTLFRMVRLKDPEIRRGRCALGGCEELAGRTRLAGYYAGITSGAPTRAEAPFCDPCGYWLGQLLGALFGLVSVASFSGLPPREGGRFTGLSGEV